jgi:hypothetical protein
MMRSGQRRRTAVVVQGVDPVEPVEPVGPVGPDGPLGPLGPLGPVAPPVPVGLAWANIVDAGPNDAAPIAAKAKTPAAKRARGPDRRLRNGDIELTVL